MIVGEVFYGVTGVFDDDSFGLGFFFLHNVGTIDIQRSLYLESLSIFPFDSELDSVSGFDFFVIHSKAFIEVALVALLS